MDEKQFDPQEDIPWSDLAASVQWQQVKAYCNYALDVLRRRMEDPQVTEDIADLRFQQGRICALRELVEAPERYRRMAELLRENQRGAGKVKD